MRTWLTLSAICLFCSLSFAADPLVIHEWGTFTSLQDENGRAIGWINTDDEPVPSFVHTLDASQEGPHTDSPGALMNDQQQRSPMPQMQQLIADYLYQPAIIAR